MEKSGSTALANWLVKNGIARYTSPGIKEPYTYAQAGATPPPPPPRPGELPWLDASVGYARNPIAIANLPRERTRIIVCLRNPLDRTWSSYRFKKIIASKNDATTQLSNDFFASTGGTEQLTDENMGYEDTKRKFAQHFPKESFSYIESYFDNEAGRLRSGTFRERIDYETAFLFFNQYLPLSVGNGIEHVLLRDKKHTQEIPRRRCHYNDHEQPE